MRKILKSYFFWTYPRGSFHYDVMVTLILAFIFFSPLLINYRERPQENPGSSSEVLVKTDGANAFLYEIGADQIGGKVDEATLRAELLRRIRAISGPVEMDRYSAQKDASGRVTEYRVWGHR
jgi:hypothetical protein